MTAAQPTTALSCERMRAHASPAESAWTDAHLAEGDKLRAVAWNRREESVLDHDMLEHLYLQIPERELFMVVLGGVFHLFLFSLVKIRPRKKVSSENLAANKRAARFATAMLFLLQVAVIWGAVKAYQSLVLWAYSEDFDASIGIRNLPELLGIWIGLQLVFLPVSAALIPYSSLWGGWKTRADLRLRYARWQAPACAFGAVCFLLCTVVAGRQEVQLDARMDTMFAAHFGCRVDRTTVP